jgi:hypothetical protein
LSSIIGVSAKKERNLNTIENQINSFYNKRKKSHKDEEETVEPFRI